MKSFKSLAAATGLLVLTAAPAFALPPQAPSNAGTAHAPTAAVSDSSTETGAPTTTPTGTTNPGTAHRTAGSQSGAKGKAYGKYCKAESKKHVDGQSGTAFSKCVTAMAKVAKGSSPTACKVESKKHVDG